MIPTRWPAPSGTNASSARTPVGSGRSTRRRSSGFGRGRLERHALDAGQRPAAVERTAQGVDDAAEQAVAGGDARGGARGQHAVPDRHAGEGAERHAGGGVAAAVPVQGHDLRRQVAGRGRHGDQVADTGADAADLDGEADDVGDGAADDGRGRVRGLGEPANAGRRRATAS